MLTLHSFLMKNKNKYQYEKNLIIICPNFICGNINVGTKAY